MTPKTFLYPNQIILLPVLSGDQELEGDEYQVLELFPGGMGICAKIQHCNTKKNYALKVIHSDLLTESKAYERYIEELKIWIVLSACNGVARAYCVTSVNQIPCIIAEWMPQGNLRPFIGCKEPLFFFRSFDSILKTLKWTVENYKIIHRDLKPENILVDNKGLTYVSDWGLARPISSGQINVEKVVANPNDYLRPNLTEAGTFIGTICYSSPEQILGMKELDHRSDIYSLGCIMYEWETGNPPFLGKTPLEIALQHLHERPKQLGGFFKATNFGVEHIIHKCLEKRSEDRFQTYNELIDEFLSVAKKRKIDFPEFVVTERFKLPLLGKGEFDLHLNSRDPEFIYSKDGQYVVAELSRIQPYLEEARALLQLSEWKKASDILCRFYFDDIYRNCPDDKTIQGICVGYGLALVNLGRPNEAIEVLKVIQSAKHKSVEYFLNLSMAYLRIKDFVNAESITKQGIQLFHDDADLIGNLTVSLIQQKKYDEAFKYADQQVKLIRDVKSLVNCASLLFNIAEEYKNIDLPNAIANYNSALKLYDESLLLNPIYPIANMNRGLILFKLRKYEDTIKSLTKFLNMKHTDINRDFYEGGLTTIANCLLWTSDYEGCVKFCNKWLDKFPNSYTLQRVRSEAYVDGYLIGNIKDGIRIIEESSFEYFKSIVNNKTYCKPSDYEFLAKIYFWMGDSDNIDKSLLTLGFGIDSYPDYWKLHFRKSSIYYEIGLFDEALQYVQEAAKHAPWRESIPSLLASIYEAMGRHELADESKKRSEEIVSQKERLYNNQSRCFARNDFK